MIKLYGWTELNTVAATIRTIERDAEEFEANDGGEVYLKSADDSGRWFLNFTDAKRAAVRSLAEQIKELRSAITFVKSQKKGGR